MSTACYKAAVARWIAGLSVVAALLVATNALGARTSGGVGVVGISARVRAGYIAHIGITSTGRGPGPCILELEPGTYVHEPESHYTRKALVWTWRVPLTAPLGKTTVAVACRGAGTLRTHMTILRPH